MNELISFKEYLEGQKDYKREILRGIWTQVQGKEEFNGLISEYEGRIEELESAIREIDDRIERLRNSLNL